MSDLVALFGTTDFPAAVLRFTCTLLAAALGGLYSEKSGISNIGLEGMMLMGAFTGVLGSMVTGSPWIGLAAALAGGGALGLLHGVLTVRFGVDHIISGLGVNFVSLGLTSFFARVVFGITMVRQQVAAFTPVPVPLLGDLPIVGTIFFRQIPLVYLSLGLVVVTALVLTRTSWGLRIRAVGEHPRAADTRGVAVRRVRLTCVGLSGMLCGLGGAFLSLGQINTFVDNMTAGRGFIAFAALIFGRWQPWRTLAATALFGSAEALQVRLQALSLDVPHQVLLMIPYVLTLLALAGMVGRTEPPAALGLPYPAEER